MTKCNCGQKNLQKCWFQQDGIRRVSSHEGKCPSNACIPSTNTPSERIPNQPVKHTSVWSWAAFTETRLNQLCINTMSWQHEQQTCVSHVRSLPTPWREGGLLLHLHLLPASGGDIVVDPLVMVIHSYCQDLLGIGLANNILIEVGIDLFGKKKQWISIMTDGWTDETTV